MASPRRCASTTAVPSGARPPRPPVLLRRHNSLSCACGVDMQANSIGYWYYIFIFITMLAIFTNTGCFVITAGPAARCSQGCCHALTLLPRIIGGLNQFHTGYRYEFSFTYVYIAHCVLFTIQFLASVRTQACPQQDCSHMLISDVGGRTPRLRSVRSWPSTPTRSPCCQSSRPVEVWPCSHEVKGKCERLSAQCMHSGRHVQRQMQVRAPYAVSCK